MNESNFLQTIENSYKETDDGEFSTLSVLLTPMDLLKSDERFARAKLYQKDSEEIELDIVHDRFNEKDNKALEVYYDKTFIGYVRKRFTNEYIDYIERVNQFCFDENKLRGLQILWNGINFIIRGESFEKIQKLKEEKESLLKDIYDHGDIMFGQNLNTVSTELRNDKELVLEYVSIIGWELEHASEQLKNDKEVVMAALNTRLNSNVLKYASSELKNDQDIIWEASKKNSNGFKYASKELLSNKTFILETIDKGMWWVFEHADERLKKDKEVVVHAIEKTGSNLEYCTQELQGNKKIVLMAVETNGNALQYASKALQHDKDVVLTAVERSGYALQYTSDKLKNDKDVILTAVKNEGSVLQYASDSLRNDRDIVLMAIKNNGNSFEYADEILRNDVEIASSALLHSDLDYWSIIEERIFENTTEDILKNKFFLLNAIKNNVPILKMLEQYYGYFNNNIWLFDINDKDIILTTYKKFGNNELQYASKKLLSDKNFVMELINVNTETVFSNTVLYYLDDELKNDIDVVHAAISKNWRELEYAGEELKNNKDIIKTAINIDVRALKYARSLSDSPISHKAQKR